MDVETRSPLVAGVYGADGNQSAEIDLPASVFGVQPNMAVMHQAYLRQLANARQGTAATKTRGEVSGGGGKPYRQKGTGRARHGSTREPSMVGGGTVFGPQPRSYRQDMPRKMRRLALRSALSVKAQEGKVRVLEGFDIEEPSTAGMFDLLRAVGVEETALVVLAASNLVVQRSVSNLPWAKAILWSNLNLYDLFTHDDLVVQKGALEALWETFGAADGSSYDVDASTRTVEAPAEDQPAEAEDEEPAALEAEASDDDASEAEEASEAEDQEDEAAEPAPDEAAGDDVDEEDDK
ncbi:MAG: 50S ribosomal protein L4 [Candidatus Dormibacteraeota bacterium]|nr:50S ribosomal protein L4 [Candidatus Dormibacteraeota bacterium]